MLVPIVAVLFALFSSAFGNGGSLAGAPVWNRDGCTGANLSPALHWSDPPVGSKGLALAMFDPDAGRAGWWHWIVYDIPVRQRALPAGVTPAARGIKQGVNDFGTAGYGGPCPPPGPAHHYIFTLYALDEVRLNAPAAVHGPEFLRLVAHHIVATAKLTGRYGR